MNINKYHHIHKSRDWSHDHSHTCSVCQNYMGVYLCTKEISNTCNDMFANCKILKYCIYLYSCTYMYIVYTYVFYCVYTYTVHTYIHITALFRLAPLESQNLRILLFHHLCNCDVHLPLNSTSSKFEFCPL